MNYALVCAYSELINSEVRILQTIARTPWTEDQSVARPLPTQDNTNRINANIQASSVIGTHDSNVFEREKKFYAIDPAAIVMGSVDFTVA
jgi:hypothetical protein